MEIYITGYFGATRKLQQIEMSAASTWPSTVSGDMLCKCLVDTSVRYEKKKTKKKKKT